MRSFILFLAGLLASLFHVSCTKELDFDYGSVAPIPVIEAYASSEGVRVCLTRSREVEDSSRNHFVAGARVAIFGSDGSETRLDYAGSGVYVAPSAVFAPGEVCSLRVESDDGVFVSSDTMALPPIDAEVSFTWDDIMGSETVSMRFGLMTPADSTAYFAVVVTRNGEVYNWGVFNNVTRHGGHVEGGILCFNREDLEGKDQAGNKARPEIVIHDGDRVDVCFVGLSKRSYDYLAALSLSSSTGANPRGVFSGDALGLFAAVGVLRVPTIVFSLDSLPAGWRPGRLKNQ